MKRLLLVYRLFSVGFGSKEIFDQSTFSVIVYPDRSLRYKWRSGFNPGGGKIDLCDLDTDRLFPLSIVEFPTVASLDDELSSILSSLRSIHSVEIINRY